ncbi:HPr family phosphocarrier protein [Clostridium lacusfryxellense]|uniref:HPr family phosphocarrier protein n=1 Tax=Clostridium lacusfryxellense TaxID=205328 RepID=UPI001C0B1C9B|nr:HPr family phosphocarrier protein [Clostridium lacusfryxellense]MBU3111873.1 HPr family phosphocarrier protein [Clostridium lacusfryxellense]
MMEKKAIVKSETGIHARPALTVVKEASKFKSEVLIVKDGNEYNAKSIVAIMCMAAIKNDELIIKTTGVDEEAAAVAMVKVIEEGLVK